MKPLCILSPVHPAYGWLAPFLAELVDQYWPSHPEQIFCGPGPRRDLGREWVDAEQASPDRTWSEFVLEGVKTVRSRGFEAAYLIAEEHAPLAPCNSTCLEQTLPALLESLPARYIGLLGWDNRRTPNQTRPEPSVPHQMIRLDAARAARYSVHPALWDLATLQACLELALRENNGGATAWEFEKTCGRASADLPPGWMREGFQICGRELRLQRPSTLRTACERFERFFFLKLMALTPPRGGLRKKYWDAIGFDDFFYDGPYPMFFSGLTAKGQVNAHLLRHLRRHPGFNPGLAKRLVDAWKTGAAAFPG